MSSFSKRNDLILCSLVFWLNVPRKTIAYILWVAWFFILPPNHANQNLTKEVILEFYCLSCWHTTTLYQYVWSLLGVFAWKCFFLLYMKIKKGTYFPSIGGSIRNIKAAAAFFNGKRGGGRTIYFSYFPLWQRLGKRGREVSVFSDLFIEWWDYKSVFYIIYLSGGKEKFPHFTQACGEIHWKSIQCEYFPMILLWLVQNIFLYTWSSRPKIMMVSVAHFDGTHSLPSISVFPSESREVLTFYNMSRSPLFCT